MKSLTQPLYLEKERVPDLPHGWRPKAVRDISELLKTGKLYDENSASDFGDVPVVNQSAEDWHGFHDEEPGVIASEEQPVSTFANHTCAMRLMRRPFSCIQNIFPRVGKVGVCDTVFFHYATLGRVSQSGYKGHHPIYRDAWIPLPPLDDQRRIAEVLTAYDGLIENNRRRMALLEESAQQLYAEWFVRLRYPGDEQTRLVDGLPPDWKRVELSSIINVTHGCAFQGEHFSEEPTSRILTTPGNFRLGGGIKIDKPKYYSEEGPLSEVYVLAPMDLIVTMTDLSKTCDTLGYPAFVPKLGGVSFLHNQRVGRVVPRGVFFPKYYLHCLMCDERYRYHVVGAATGVSVKHTSPKRILSYATPLPINGTLIADFEVFAEPIFQQINHLLATNGKLRTARDLLLPRLMSGEIAVRSRALTCEPAGGIIPP